MANNEPAPTLLSNARVILSERTIESANLLITNGRIAGIVDSSSQVPASASTLDLTGLTLFPGFIDLHIHGAFGVDTMEASAEDLNRVGEFLAGNGVTAWLPTLVPAAQEEYEHAIRAIAEAMNSQGGDRGQPVGEKAFVARDEESPESLRARRLRSRILGVHYEGPFVNQKQCGALHTQHFRTFTSQADLNDLPTIQGDHAIHMTTLAPEVNGGIELIRELQHRNWIVSIGHTRATTDILDQALAAGARHMTHFMNAMTALHHRAPGPVGWGLMHDEVSCDLIADGIHLDPSILKLILRNKKAQRISLISDAVAATGLGDGEYEIWGEQITVKNGRTQNAKGSIAGSVITMLDAVRLMSKLGFSENDLALMSSLNPARLLGIDQDCGSIEAGKRADLVALDDNENVHLTIIGGQIAFSAS